MSNAELSKIQFESDDELSSAPNTDSEAESAVTVESNPEDSLYEVDAIKHAVWRDSTRPGPGYRADGWRGWHYKWRGYLKTLSETEEPITVFETPTYFDDDLGKEVVDPEYTRDADMVVQFWKAFDTRQLPQLKLSSKQREPGDPGPKLRYPYVFECPNEQMRKWVNETNGKRTFGTWLSRQIWERQHPTEPTIKRYSDYYVYKKRQQQIRAEKQFVGGSHVLLPKRSKKDKKEKVKAKDVGSATDKVREKDKMRGKGKDTEKAIDKPKSKGMEKSNSIAANAAEPSTSTEAKSSKKRKFRMDSEVGSDDSTQVDKNSTVGSGSGTKYPKPSSKSSKSNIPPGLAAHMSAVPVSATVDDEQMDTDSIAVDQALQHPPSPSYAPSESSLGSDFDSDHEGVPSRKASAAPETFDPIPTKTIAKAAPSANPEDLAALFPSPPRKSLPGEMAAKLEGLGRIKKRDPNSVPPPKDIRAPTPQFGEPDPGIFSSQSVAPSPAPASALVPVASVVLPRSVPSKPKPMSRPAPPAPSASASNLLKSTLAALGAQAKTADNTVDDAATTELEPSAHQANQSSSSGFNQSSSTTAFGLPPTPTPMEEMPNVAERPKYQQPGKVKFIDDAPVQSRSRPAAPLSSSLGVTPTVPRGMHSPYRDGQSPLQGGSSTYQALPSRPSATSAYASRDPFPIQPPTRPRAVPEAASSRHSDTYGSRQPGPLPDQKALYAVSQPNPPPPPQHAPPPLPPQPTYPPPVQSFDPRLPRLISPQQPYSAVLPGPPAQHIYNPAGDPRLRDTVCVGKPPTPRSVHAATYTPNPHGSTSPRPSYARSPRSPGGDPRKTSASSALAPRYESLCQISATVPVRAEKVFFEVGLLRGASASSSEYITMFLGPVNGNRKSLVFEEIDDICTRACMRLGGHVVEWARATVIENGRAGKAEWETLRRRATREQKAFVSYTELRGQPGISAHYALVLAPPEALDMSKIGLGGWNLEEIKLAVFVLALPLESGSIPVPRLPNPVRPNFGETVDEKPAILPSEMSVLDSYGLDYAFMSSLRNRSAVKYPGSEGPMDALHDSVIDGFKIVGVVPVEGTNPPDNLLVANQKFANTLRSSTVRGVLSRRTAIYAFGPNLQLYPSQWTRRKIWQKGGLVTFSPTFILRSPDKFVEIMKTIRSVDSWAAYVLPSVIEWCHTSWSEPARCPEPMKAFEALSKSLFLDENLLRLSGSLGPSGGGLAVSCAPPVVHDAEGCHRWMEWLQKVSDERVYEGLTGLCFGVQPRDFAGPVAEPKPRDLELVDIERSQMEDLVSMRAKPHLLPYRRYLYIGEISLDPKSKLKFENEIELIVPENFAAIISGAV